MTAPNWRDDAACQSLDGENFYPISDTLAEPAKKVCWSRCPVRQDCLTYALEAGERFGVWGGLTEKERRALVRQQNSYQRRKADVARMVTDGLDAQQIAHRLGLTRKALRAWARDHQIRIPATRGERIPRKSVAA